MLGRTLEAVPLSQPSPLAHDGDEGRESDEYGIMQAMEGREGHEGHEVSSS